VSSPQEPPDYSKTSTGLSDGDVRGAMHAAIRLLAVLSVVAAALFWWRGGWQSALLLCIGAAISGASLWEWLRLISAINQRMDAGATPRPMDMILLGFFARLGITVAVLYGSLKFLRGTVFALAAGLLLGLLSLTYEAVRLLKRPESSS
jgi:hypothetical protein